MHKEVIKKAGNQDDSKKALIMIHGRGGNATQIMDLARLLHVSDFLLLAPQATNNTWYPMSFIAPVEQNQPWLDSALDAVEATVQEANKLGIVDENIYFLGFSQGACLALEYVARSGKKFGGAVALSGGLIGKQLNVTNYANELNGMPIYIGSSDPDTHIPVSRVLESRDQLVKMNASVTADIFPGMGHTIILEEINKVNDLIFGKK